MAKLERKSFKILTKLNNNQFLKKVEIIARDYYEDEYEDLTAEQILKDLIDKERFDVLDHIVFTVKFIMSMYDTMLAFDKVSFGIPKFNNDVSFIVPEFISDQMIKTFNSEKLLDNRKDLNEWYLSLLAGEKQYFDMIDEGDYESFARKSLPMAVKTITYYTGTLREWWDLIRKNMKQPYEVANLFENLRNRLRSEIPNFID